MNDVRPKVTLLVHTPEPVEVCKRAAGVCVGNPAGSMAGLKHAIKSGHESVLEHVSFTFMLQDVSRVLLAQLTRHRIASYSVESQRYVSYKDGFKVHIPMDSYELCTMPELMDLYEAAMTYSENIYKQLLEAGVDAEVARYVLPNAATTTIVVTMNARELRHFFRMRCCNRAQAEIRYVAREMLKLCEGVAYELFEDAGPACKVGPCKETKPCGNPIYAMPCTTPEPEPPKPSYNYAVRVDENGDLAIKCTSKGAPSPLLVGGGGGTLVPPLHPGCGGDGSTDPVRILVGGSGYVPER